MRDESDEDGQNENAASNSSPQPRETNRRRILRSLRSLLPRSVSEVELEGDNISMELVSSSESDREEENRLFEEYLQQNDGPAEEFNTELPTEHSYLGQMDAVNGFGYFESGKTYRLQIFEHHSIVFPGETLPMIFSDSQFERSEYSQDGLNFGLVFWDPQFKQKVGVTCQVYEKGVDSHGNITLKCRAHQRFVVLKQENGSYLIPGAQYRRRCSADVIIQPEVELPPPLKAVVPDSLKRFLAGSKYVSQSVYHRASTLTSWPKFVYDQYDISKVLRKLPMLNLGSVPEDLVVLSFWLARNVPITEKQRYQIFITNSVTQRLIILGKALDVMCFFSCKRCKNRLAKYSDLISMSKQGTSNFCNPSGYIHFTSTLKKMIENSSYLVDRPSTEFSWFPGYAWQILLCKGN